MALDIRGLSVTLGGQSILHDFNLTAAPGELLVLAGPSGSGKTTLLRSIAGLTPAQRGEILLDGQRIDRMPPGVRDVAMMFQSYALFPHLNVYDNLAFGLRARGHRGADLRQRVDDVAGRLGLSAHLGRMPGELSGGERQRVALGRALLRRPRLFLMDEPLSNLDAQLRVRARAEVMRLHRELGSVTLYVTHDQNEALAIADRLGVMRGGRLVQFGRPLDVYHAPDCLFVAQFLGSPPINLLEVAVDEGTVVNWRGHRLPLPARWNGAIGERGRRLLLGVRPEHLHLEHSRWAPSMDDAPLLGARVDTVEPVGDQQYILLDADGQPLTVRAEPELRLNAGDAVQVRLDPERLHLFDCESGRSLAAGAAC
jgi:ABC-type sugar transport system ATPase subunit